MKQRRIPSLMATQHPDNASSPYWKKDNNPFINTLDELEDAMHSFKELNATEYMWDWEGKFADASIIDRLYSQHIDYFKQHPIGEDKYITFRLPNIWQEKGYNLLQAMHAILVAEDQAKDLGFEQRPLFEVILPMTENANQLLKMHELFHRLANFKNKHFNSYGAKNVTDIKLIPLVESVTSQQQIGKLLKTYYQLVRAESYKTPSYIRPFIACSDPAIVSGWLATKLANKSAISQSFIFADQYGVDVYPITGVGGLTFRGGLSPQTVDQFIANNHGVRTVTLQSAFRFDYPTKQVNEAAQKLTAKLRRSSPFVFSDRQQTIVNDLIKQSETSYQKTLKKLLPDMQSVFKAVPKRRERRQHIGLLAYGRKSGGNRMPRAITFTASFYSLGVPPEFIGLGKCLTELTTQQLKLLEQSLPGLAIELSRAGKFINHDNINILAKRNKAWRLIQQDIKMSQEILNLDLSPKTIKEKSHRNLTSNCLILKNNPTELSELIASTGELRGGLG